MNLSPDLLKQLSINVALVAGLGLLYSLISYPLNKNYPRSTQAVLGIMFGAAAIGCMNFPVLVAPGVIVDGKTIVVPLAGFFFGPLAGGLAALIAGIYRWYLGGVGAVAGVYVLLSGAALGAGFYALRRWPRFPRIEFALMILGGGVAVNALLASFILPMKIALEILPNIWLGVLTIYPIGMVLVGMLLNTIEARNVLLEEALQNAETLRQTKHALEVKEERLQLALDGATDGLWDWDLQTNETFFSARYYTMLDYHPAEFPMNYAEWHQRIHPDDVARAEQAIQAHLQNQTPHYEVELRMRDKANHWRWILARGRAVRHNAQGRPTRMVGTHSDITARKHAEEALGDSQQRLTAIIESTIDAIISVNAEQRIILFNTAAERIFKYSAQEVLGQSLDLLIPARYHRLHRTLLAGFQGKVRGMERQHTLYAQRADGVEFPIEASISELEIQGEKIYTVLLSDITARYQAEQALRESEARFRLLAENSTDMISRHDPQGLYLYASPACRLLLGYTPEELLGHSAFEFIHPDDIPLVDQSRVNITTSPTISTLTFRARHKTGHLVWLETTSRAILDEATGSLAEIHAATRDVTARKLAEISLQESQTLLQRTLESAPIILFTLDPHGIFQLSTGAGLKSIGLKPGQVVGLSHFEVYKDLKHANESAQRALAGESVNFTTEALGVTWNMHYSPVRGATGEIKGMLGVAVDITERQDAELALQASEKKYRLLFENMTSGFAVHQMLYDEQGHPNNYRYLEINPAFEKLTGFPVAGMVGKTIKDLMPNTEAYWIQVFGKVAQTGEPLAYMNYSQSLGKYYDTYVFCPEKDKFAVVFNDVTERVTAELAVRHERDRAQNYLDTVEAIIVALDREGRIKLMNRKGCRLLGYAEEELVGKSWFATCLPQSDDAENVYAYFLKIVNGQVETLEDYENTVITRTGELRQIAWHNTILQDEHGHIIGALSAGEDITERKRAEDALRLLNEQLEQRVQERTAQLEAANKELEAFSYSISHDLRAPLRALDGYSHILQEEHAGQLPSEGAQHLMNIRVQAKRMRELIDDLLKFSRLSRQPLKKQDLQPAKIIQHALDTLSNTASTGRALEILIGDLPSCEGDASLLTQVWINLLSNAIKYTRPPETPRIEIGHQMNAHGESVYFVRDHGIGFDMQYVGKLFGVFQRLHSESEFEGTGVGLALTQRIITRHGGRIWAESVVGQGSTFYFTLPVKTDE